MVWRLARAFDSAGQVPLQDLTSSEDETPPVEAPEAMGKRLGLASVVVLAAAASGCLLWFGLRRKRRTSAQKRNT